MVSELNALASAKSRKAYSRILQALAGRQTAIATLMGVNDSTITRIKERLEDAVMLIYLSGFKIVESDAVIIGADELHGLQAQAMRLIAYEREHGRLDDE